MLGIRASHAGVKAGWLHSSAYCSLPPPCTHHPIPLKLPQHALQQCEDASAAAACAQLWEHHLQHVLLQTVLDASIKMYLSCPSDLRNLQHTCMLGYLGQEACPSFLRCPTCCSPGKAILLRRPQSSSGTLDSAAAARTHPLSETHPEKQRQLSPPQCVINVATCLSDRKICDASGIAISAACLRKC